MTVTKKGKTFPTEKEDGPFSPLLRRDNESGPDSTNTGPGNSIRERGGDSSGGFSEGRYEDSDLLH